MPESEARWKLAEEALKGVWASKYNDRAFYSMRKVGRGELRGKCRGELRTPSRRGLGRRL